MSYTHPIQYIRTIKEHISGLKAYFDSFLRSCLIKSYVADYLNYAQMTQGAYCFRDDHRHLQQALIPVVPSVLSSVHSSVTALHENELVTVYLFKTC